ncbi:hypothetical protein AMATHDRAFT_52478 [Amanita thiersii Skay4041]|uniref:Uncharacterized protein n=1 Tax=Amanita thiersii Skay4041 TaxID=703135 RepID=A0A2A9P0R2_9AGAR|nr:hypothetical protein AMATHDRAFT_52478 [Amanita thiersii Skay4041]
MWCTRWFLPLLLLPLPTAPPFFLLLFLFSLTMHAKPCFYCIVLLTTLFVSSCYWQPFPLDSPLSTPWSENITTFAEALSTALPSNYTDSLPTVIRAVDRCWCDFSGGFFEPFNVSHWEYLTVQRLKNELERLHVIETEGNGRTLSTNASVTRDGATIEDESKAPKSDFGQKLLRGLVQLNHRLRERGAGKEEEIDVGERRRRRRRTEGKEYDLFEYGIDMVLDFSW